MSDSRPKTSQQLQRLFGLARGRADDAKAFLEELAVEISEGRVERLSCLSFDEANAMIHRLGGDMLLPGGRSRRTVNHRRRQAGVLQIATVQHLKLMDDLAAKRGITIEGLQRLCRRMLKGNSRPRTTSETNKIIEAIKKMNERDRRSAKEVAE